MWKEIQNDPLTSPMIESAAVHEDLSSHTGMESLKVL